MHSLLALPKRKSTKNSLKDAVATVVRLDTRQQIVLTRKARKKRTQKTNLTKRRHKKLKRTVKETARLTEVDNLQGVPPTGGEGETMVTP